MAVQSLSDDDPVQVAYKMRRAPQELLALTIVLIAVASPVYVHYLDVSGDVPMWVTLIYILFVVVATVMFMRWWRAKWIAVNDVLERDFNFNWYACFFKANVSAHRHGSKHRRAVAMYWGARAKMAYVRGNFAQVFGYLNRIDLSAFGSGPYSLAGVECFASGYTAALLTGDRNWMAWCYTAIIRYPVRSAQNKQKVLATLVERDAMVNGGIPPRTQGAADGLSERLTPFAHMEHLYFRGLWECRQGNVAHADELMRQIVEQGHGNQEIYYVRQAQAKLRGNGV